MKKKDCIAKTVVTSSAEETVRAVMCSGLIGYRVLFILGFLFDWLLKGRIAPLPHKSNPYLQSSPGY